MHVSTLNIGAHAFDSVKAFFERRSKFRPVRLIVAEDNEAVIKTVAKGRSAKLRHVARTHRVNLDWLLERRIADPCIYCRYIDTKAQIADILTKPNFTVNDWCQLCSLFRLGPPPAPAEVKISKTASSSIAKSSLSTSIGSILKDAQLSYDEQLEQLFELIFDAGGDV